ncbi:MAG: hypothetical protein ACRDZ7_04135 [Acidimicrobiia bacterium]
MPVVRQFPPGGRRALYAAANAGLLRRGSWEGCALNRAGAAVGVPVRSRGEAAYAFDTTPDIARQFVEVWDRLWGSNRRCTQMLRDAIEEAGLFEDEAGLPVPPPGKVSVS